MYKPLIITDPVTHETHEEWMCKKCDGLSFATVDSNKMHKDLVADIYREGYLTVEELPDGDEEAEDGN